MSKPGISILLLLVLGAASGAAQTKPVEVPMKFRDGMPAIDVMVNGQGPFLFAIDTAGQGDARADTALVERLGLRKVGEARAGDSSGRNARTLDIVRIDSIGIGDLEFRDLDAPTRSYNGRSPVKIDGILGFGLFKDHLLTLDYTAKKVRIEEGSLPEANSRDIVDFEDPRGIPVIEVFVGDRGVKAQIDSGNSVGGFTLPTAIVESSRLASEPRVVGTAQTVANTFEVKQARLEDSIRLGGFEYREPTVVYPAPSDANIGAAVLRDFSLTFDQRNKRVKLAQTIWKDEPAAAGNRDSALQEYVGQYGDRTVSSDGENLFIQRPGGMRIKLLDVSKDEFEPEIAPGSRIEFIRDGSGKVVEIDVLTPSGVWEKAKRG